MSAEASGGLPAAVYRVLRRGGLALPLTLYRQGLRTSGWRRSNRAKRPVDADGRPIPWYTYPAIHLLDERLPSDARVFEYGAGNSTLWYAARVAEVVSVEHEPDWAAAVARTAPANAEIVLREGQEAFAAEISDRPAFDVVVIDSLHWRVECATAASGRVTDRGIVIWDNSDRDDFTEAFHRRRLFPGFRELPLLGFGPCGGEQWKTSILYRDGNCLGI